MSNEIVMDSSCRTGTAETYYQVAYERLPGHSQQMVSASQVCTAKEPLFLSVCWIFDVTTFFMTKQIESKKPSDGY